MNHIFEYSDIIITNDLIQKVYGKGKHSITQCHTKYDNSLILDNNIQQIAKQEYVRDYHIFINMSCEKIVYSIKQSVLLLFINKQDMDCRYYAKISHDLINKDMSVNGQFINYIQSDNRLYNQSFEYGQKLSVMKINKDKEFFSVKFFLFIYLILALFYASLDYLSR